MSNNLPKGVSVVNISPDGMPAFYEAKGRHVIRHFKRNDLINQTEDPALLEKLCVEQIRLGPAVIAAERMAAQMNDCAFFPLQAAGYNRLSSLFYQAKMWAEVIRLHDEAANSGWNVDEMENRVHVARRKLGILTP